MNKAIIVLSGSPEAKNKFAEIVKRVAWVWAINAKDLIRENLKLFYWDGSRTEDVNKLVLEQFELFNKNFDFEKKYLSDKITKFNEDDSEFKTNGSNTFDKFVLISHGVSKDILPYLQEEYGVFKIHLSRKDYNSNEKFPNDVTVLYEDGDDFVVEVNKIIEILTKGSFANG